MGNRAYQKLGQSASGTGDFTRTLQRTR
jgi:hypothetical protein